MTVARISSDIIVEKIKSSPNDFDLSTSGLIFLLKNSVKENVIDEMFLSSEVLPILRNHDIIEMYQNKIPRNMILKKIQYSDCDFNTATESLIELQSEKIPDQIIKSMMNSDLKVLNKSEKTLESKLSENNSQKKQSNKQNSIFRSSESRSDEKSITKSNDSNAKVQCNEWFDKFKKIQIKTAFVDIRNWKPVTSLLGSFSSVVGIEDSEVKSVLINEGGKLSMLIYVQKPGSNRLMVDTNAPLYLMLKNDDVLEFKVNVNSEIDFSYSGSSFDTQMVVYYELPKSKAIILSQNEIKSYRINLYNKKYIEDVIPEKNAQKFKLGVQCILN